MAGIAVSRARGKFREGNRVVGALAVCGIVGPVLFALVLVSLGLLRPGYNHLTQLASELGELGAPNASVMNTMFIVFGLLTVAFAFGLHRGVNGGRGSRIGPTLVAVFGAVAGVGGGLFPCDPGCPVLGETLSGTMHTIVGSVGFAALSLAPLALSQSLKRDDRWRRYHSYSLATAAVALGAFFLLASRALEPWEGAVQRVLIGTLYAWIFIMALRLLNVAGSEPSRNLDPSALAAASDVSIASAWGTKPSERRLAFPCDRYVEPIDAAYFRGVTIFARSEVIFRWLCQMRVSPYSYDRIENPGRRSPRTLIPGLEPL